VIQTQHAARPSPVAYSETDRARTSLRSHRRIEGGQGILEYALAVALVALVAVALLQVVGKRANSALCQTSTGLSGGTGGCSLSAMGANGVGQLGDGSTTDRRTPAQVVGAGGSGTLTRLTAIAAQGNTVALSSDGGVWDWGSNAYGQLGTTAVAVGSNTTSPVPVQGSGGLGLLSAVTAVASGTNFNLALKADGTVWSWGINTTGQLGDGTTTDRPTPVQVTGLAQVAAIAAGYGHGVALRSDGSVYTWGLNANGQLGTVVACGAPCFSTSPVAVTAVGGVGTLTGVRAISAGYNHVVALKTDGSIVEWGYYIPTVDAATPVVVGGISGVVAIAGGNQNQIALRSDGTVWAWGYNGQGQLGNNSTTDSATPVQVQTSSGTLTNAVAVAAGPYNAAALTADGSVWTWGDNTYGQVGDGTVNQRRTAFQVPGVAKATSVAIGWYYVTVLTRGSSPTG
jgi:alpha-tubulin suppressor-like RCC1 family protein